MPTTPVNDYAADMNLTGALPALDAVQPGKAAPLATGVTKPLADLALSMSVAGRVESVRVKEGQSVKKGDILLSLDSTLEALEVDRRKLMLDDTAKLEEARAREKTLERQVDEAHKLLQSNSLSRKQVEDEEMAYRAAVAERKALDIGKRREKVEYDLAREALERRYLRAPISGIVAKLHFKEGESVAPHEPVAKLVDVSRVRFTGNVGVATSTALHVGDTVTLRINMGAEPSERPATVVFISPVTDAASGLVEISAEFDNADASVRPGIAGQMLPREAAP